MENFSLRGEFLYEYGYNDLKAKIYLFNEEFNETKDALSNLYINGGDEDQVLQLRYMYYALNHFTQNIQEVKKVLHFMLEEDIEKTILTVDNIINQLPISLEKVKFLFLMCLFLNKHFKYKNTHKYSNEIVEYFKNNRKFTPEEMKIVQKISLKLAESHNHHNNYEKHQEILSLFINMINKDYDGYEKITSLYDNIQKELNKEPLKEKIEMKYENIDDIIKTTHEYLALERYKLLTDYLFNVLEMKKDSLFEFYFYFYLGNVFHYQGKKSTHLFQKALDSIFELKHGLIYSEYLESFFERDLVLSLQKIAESIKWLKKIKRKTLEMELFDSISYLHYHESLAKLIQILTKQKFNENLKQRYQKVIQITESMEDEKYQSEVLYNYYAIQLSANNDPQAEFYLKKTYSLLEKKLNEIETKGENKKLGLNKQDILKKLQTLLKFLSFTFYSKKGQENEANYYIKKLETMENLSEKTKMQIHFHYSNFHFNTKNFKLAKEYIDKLNEDNDQISEDFKTMIRHFKFLIYTFNEEFEKASEQIKKMNFINQSPIYRELLVFQILKSYLHHKEYQKIKDAVIIDADYETNLKKIIKIEELLEESFEKLQIYALIFILKENINYPLEKLASYLEKSLQLFQSKYQKNEKFSDEEYECILSIYNENSEYYSKQENYDKCVEILTEYLEIIEEKESQLYYYTFYKLCLHEIELGKRDSLEKLKFVVEKLETRSKIEGYLNIANLVESQFESENYLDLAMKLAQEIQDQEIIQIIGNLRQELLNK